MRNILILGAGTAGTIMANRMHALYRREVARREMAITVVDQDDTHVYQPGLLFIPFGTYKPQDVLRPRRRQLAEDVRYVQSHILALDAATDTVTLANGERLPYDACIIATGSELAPAETEGLLGDEWHKSIFDFYTLEGATALGKAFEQWKGGRLVINVVENPIKCPVAPLEFAFLADAFFTRKGMRDKVTITYATPLDGAFTKPVCSQRLTYLLEQKGINLVTEFNTGSVDAEGRRLVSWDDREVPYDLLVTIPVHKGAGFIAGTPGLGNDMNFVLTDAHTLQAQLKPNLFALGDATNVPASKAGSVAHFQAEILAENVRRFLAGEPLDAGFDGHANCFIETGFDKALLIDFNYDVEPLPGKFPLPGVGPMTLMAESRLNHIGKMAFKWVYWHVLLPGYDIPGIPPQLTMRGKDRTAAATPAA
jgi:sulfide:quinone oxidoreductase